jgi:hypothetical protein
MMKARKVAAQFATDNGYQENRTGRHLPGEAFDFARENWTARRQGPSNCQLQGMSFSIEWSEDKALAEP